MSVASMKNILLVLLFTALAGFADCRLLQRAAGGPDAEDHTWVRSDLFFGLTIPNNGTNTTNISIEQFQDFLDTVVTPLFPDGFTWIESKGQFRNKKGVIIKQKSIQLIIYSPIQFASFDNLMFVASAYSNMFDQESVLVTNEGDTMVCFAGAETPVDSTECSDSMVRRRLSTASNSFRMM